jgi:molecular chaperone HtpG
MTKETFTFQAEVSKLLDIVAHSLYSHKEIFLRELISNASDACDKLRYEALTKPELTDGTGEFQIRLSVDKKAKTLTISDNGIGMARDELSETLGTIARSGTQAFMDQLSATKEKKKKGDDGRIDLIGQFGVGFYSAFMVSDKIEVTTRKAGEETASSWVSEGTGEFSVDEATRDRPGTDVKLHIKKDEKEFLEEMRLENIVKTYSDHIGIPIVMEPTKEEDAERTLNTASALWTREKKDITADQYKEFYHHAAHAFDDPWLTMHNRIEGVLSYTNLLFIPGQQPMDLFNPDRKTHVKLYVKRVFITDDCEGLLPGYLRFAKGVVDSEDLPLNISREMFQHNPVLEKIKKALTKRILGELKKKAEKAPDEYQKFWEVFGLVLKEGLYEDFENRDKLLEIVRFRSTAGEGLVSLKDYVERMKPGQDALYYITGEEAEQTAMSPQLEGFKAKGVEVLLLTDPVDEFWITSIGMFEENPFKSATRGGADLSGITKDGEEPKKDDDKKDDADQSAAVDPLLASFKLALGETVKDVRASERLTDSPVCLVADEGDMDIHLERLLKQHKQLETNTPRVLEINADHALIKALNGIASKSDGPNTTIEDAAWLLFDQARIVEGEKVDDPSAFVRRMASIMEKGLPVA